MFVAKEPETGVPNLSFHRSMYISDEELRCRLAPRHHLTLYHEKAERMGQPLEAAMLIGPPPTAFLAAAAPVPYDVDELEVAAQLAGAPIEMRPCRHLDLMVPATTEIVIAGRFLPNERRPEGPFGEFMGYYVPVGPQAVFEVLGVTRRPMRCSTASCASHRKRCCHSNFRSPTTSTSASAPSCRASSTSPASPLCCTPWSRSGSNTRGMRARS
jgi:UbiD family decarboxylase